MIASILAAQWPAHLSTTFQRLHDADACVEGYGKLANAIRGHLAVTPKDYGMDRPIPVALILETNDFADAWWVMRNATCDRGDEWAKFLRLLACDFAERALPIWAKRYPEDMRPANAIKVARAFANGEATATELIQARDEARAARRMASYASAAAAYAAAASASAADASADAAAADASAADASAAAADASADAADADASYASYAADASYASYAADAAAERLWQTGCFRAALAAACEPTTLDKVGELAAEGAASEPLYIAEQTR